LYVFEATLEKIILYRCALRALNNDIRSVDDVRKHDGKIARLFMLT